MDLTSLGDLTNRAVLRLVATGINRLEQHMANIQSSVDRLTTAVNGLDALAHLDSHQPDLILLDLMMPVMDGLSFLKELRNTDHWRDVPVIILTALANGPLVTEARKLGVNGTLTKACFTPDQLLDTIEHLIVKNDCRNRN